MSRIIVIIGLLSGGRRARSRCRGRKTTARDQCSFPGLPGALRRAVPKASASAIDRAREGRARRKHGDRCVGESRRKNVKSDRGNGGCFYYSSELGEAEHRSMLRPKPCERSLMIHATGRQSGYLWYGRVSTTTSRILGVGGAPSSDENWGVCRSSCSQCPKVGVALWHYHL